MEKKIEVFGNNENAKDPNFYAKFKEKLEEAHDFPTDYIFKYIVPAQSSAIARLHAVFADADASFSTRESRTGKYTSMTIKVPVSDANDVIIYYNQAAAIEGIMAL